jgi:hypothetical protein
MNDAVRGQLREIVGKYGPGVCEDPHSVEALLRDLAGEHRREISVLVSAVSERVPAELLASSSTILGPVLADRLTRKLGTTSALRTTPRAGP